MHWDSFALLLLSSAIFLVNLAWERSAVHNGSCSRTKEPVRHWLSLSLGGLLMLASLCLCLADN